MNAKHARRILFVLVGLCLPASLVLLTVAASGLWGSDEPSYQGKSVSAWFEQFAQGIVVIHYGPRGQILTTRNCVGARPDPAWEAISALGSNAVPHLVKRLGVGPLESPLYAGIFMKLPQTIRSKLPSPWEKRKDRRLAAEALGALGEHASAGLPALFKTQNQSDLDSFTRTIIIQALSRIQVDQRSQDVAMLELGAQRRYADIIAIAQQSGRQGGNMTRLLADILQSPDPSLRVEAIRLLERSGPAAAPVLPQVIRALKDSDKEVRYLAARSVEAIGTKSPQVVAALRAALKDENVMVQNVTRRTLTNLAPNELLPLPAEPARN